MENGNESAFGGVIILFAGIVCEAAPRQRMATLNHKPTCDPNPADTVADFSLHVTDLRLDANPIWNRLEALGIKTIVRYYDWDPESQPCKTLFGDETNAILATSLASRSSSSISMAIRRRSSIRHGARRMLNEASISPSTTGSLQEAKVMQPSSWIALKRNQDRACRGRVYRR